MTDDQRDVVVGYEFRELYTSEQSQELVADQGEIPDSEDDREISFSWDWRIPNLPDDLEIDPESAEEHSVWFDVAIGVRVGPSPEDTNRYEAQLVGRFVTPLYPDIPLERFVKLNAVALLFPYLRQCVSDLSGWSAEGKFRLPIVNVGNLMEGVELEASTGWKDLNAHPELAEMLGVSHEKPEVTEE